MYENFTLSVKLITSLVALISISLKPYEKIIQIKNYEAVLNPPHYKIALFIKYIFLIILPTTIYMFIDQIIKHYWESITPIIITIIYIIFFIDLFVFNTKYKKITGSYNKIILNFIFFKRCSTYFISSIPFIINLGLYDLLNKPIKEYHILNALFLISSIIASLIYMLLYYQFSKKELFLYSYRINFYNNSSLDCKYIYETKNTYIAKKNWRYEHADIKGCNIIEYQKEDVSHIATNIHILNIEKELKRIEKELKVLKANLNRSYIKLK